MTRKDEEDTFRIGEKIFMDLRALTLQDLYFSEIYRESKIQIKKCNHNITSCRILRDA